VKLLYFLTNYPFYSETFVAEEIRQLQEAGHTVSVCNFTWYKSEQDGKKELIYNNTKNPLLLIKAILQGLIKGESHLTNSKTWLYVLSCARLKPHFVIKYVYLLFSLDYMHQKVKQIDFDIAISHFLFKSTLAGFFICNKLNKHYHIRLHTKRSLYTKKVLTDVLQSASNITAESQDVGAFFEKVLNKPNSIKTVRQSIDFFKLAALQSDKIRSEVVQVVAIGRLVKKKGFDVLIMAIASNLDTFSGKLRCEIYGDGPLQETLQNLIETTNTTDIVKLCGRADHLELMSKLANADLLIVPSIELENDIDGVPTVIAEAMSVKTTVLASDIGGISELVANNKTGFLVKPNDVNSLAKEIKKLLDGTLRCSVLENAKIKVAQEYQHTLAVELSLIK
jgi:colanic acid/amylovoran biosynthesis glycosyltransferase